MTDKHVPPGHMLVMFRMHDSNVGPEGEPVEVYDGEWQTYAAWMESAKAEWEQEHGKQVPSEHGCDCGHRCTKPGKGEA